MFWKDDKQNNFVSISNWYFYLKPNGIFYIAKVNIPGVCKTEKVKNKNTKYDTQSGSILFIDSSIYTSFKKDSANINIRKRVGILPSNSIIFAMSNKKINLYDFAKYFKDLGCKNALFFDAFVSRTYLPSQNWNQTDGDFGALVAVTKDAKPIKK